MFYLLILLFWYALLAISPYYLPCIWCDLFTSP